MSENIAIQLKGEKFAYDILKATEKELELNQKARSNLTWQLQIQNNN